MERQQQTVERVDSVEEHLRAVKESLHARLGAAEESLQGLQLSQSSLAEGLRSSIKKELQEEFSREFPFIPGREPVEAPTREPAKTT